MSLSKKILIIDDEADLTLMIKYRLENSGYEVSTAHSGEEGLRELERIKPDLVLLDVIMPHMDGLETLYKIKNNYIYSGKIPVIMLTGKKDLDSMFQAKGFGSSEYITKPFDSEELVRLVDSYLGFDRNPHNVFSGNDSTKKSSE